MSYADLGKQVKAKYPEYANIPDDQLGEQVYAKYPQYKNVVDQPDAAAQPAGKTVEGFGKNVLSSLGDTVGGILDAVTHPISTVKTIGQGVVGAGQLAANKLTGEQKFATPETQVAQDIGQFYKGRYGSLQSLQDTLYNDPVGALLDLSSIVDLGGSAVGVVGKVGKAADVAKAGATASKAARTASPLNVVGEQVSGILNKAGKGVGEAVDTATKTIENKKSLSSVGKAQQIANDAKGTVDALRGYGIDRVSDWGRVAEKVTGAGGVLPEMIRQAIDTTGKPVSFDGILDMAKREANVGIGGKDMFKNVAAEDKAFFMNVKDAIQNSFRSDVPGGIVDPLNALDEIKNLEAIRSDIMKKVSAQNASQTEIRQAKKYKQIIDEMKTRLYTDTGADEIVAAGGHLTGLEEKLAQLPLKLQKEVRNAKTIQELRSLQLPFVHASKMDDLIKRASRVVAEAPEGFWEKYGPKLAQAVGGTGFSIASQNPLAFLLPYIADSDIVRELSGTAARATGRAAGKAVTATAKAGAKVAPAAKSPALQSILKLVGQQNRSD